MSTKDNEPTEADIMTLARALLLEREFGSGIFPMGGGQHAQYRKLAKFGMLKFTGEMGRDIDSVIEEDVPIWKLTPEGRDWITKRQADAEAKLVAEFGPVEIVANEQGNLVQ